jgi:hypothetical protein
MKDKIVALMEKERNEQISFLAKERIDELIEKLQSSRLSDDEKREIADHILANYIGGSDGDQVEDLIDWLLLSKYDERRTVDCP